MAYKLHQGIIEKYVGPTTCDIVEVPNGFRITGARLPLTVNNQYKPLEGSVVLVASDDQYKSYIISVMRDPSDNSKYSLNKDGVLRGAAATTQNFLQQGEIYFESRGNPSIPIAGTGSSLYLSNAGTVTLFSGQREECLIIGGRITDEDHEVVLQGTNGFFQSTIDEISQIRSVFKFDKDNNISVGNILTLTTGPVLIETPVAELKFDSSGNITLRNTILPAGADKGTIEIDTLGIVTLNNGSLGVARLNDEILSNNATDSTFWAMPTALQAFMNALSGLTGSLSPVAAAAQSYLAQVTVAPTSLTGKINSASTTVKAG
jgi:hypothetical protein